MKFMFQLFFMQESTSIRKLKTSGVTGDNSTLLYLESDTFRELPFDLLNCKVYIDGVRISHDQIIILEGNTIIINPTYYDFTDDSVIDIYAQAHDQKSLTKNVMEYDFDSHFMTQVSKSNEMYRNYIIQKYNK